MGRPSRFDSEFRAHAVELVRVSNKPRAHVAKSLGVSDTTLNKWMSQANHTPDDDTLNISERHELFTLRAEKREWLMEREILKKATAFWVKESKG
jgi:transposase